MPSAAASDTLRPASFAWWGALVPARRVVRGGSWNDDPLNARASYRNDNAPDNRNNHVGLRVVRVAHIFPLPSMAQVGLHGQAWLSRVPLLALPMRGALPVLVTDYGLWLAAKVRKMAQVRPARTGHQVCRAETQARRLLGASPETPHPARIHPPSKRPISATMRLTC